MATVANSTAVAQPCLTRHTPVPYLLGGLASMLGLVAFALLILACSYCRRSGRPHNAGEDAGRDVERGENDWDLNKQVNVYEEEVFVIMAGDERPTFLATAVSTKASSFGGENGNFNDGEGSEAADSGGVKVKEEMGNS
ncbi:glutamine dumper 1 [Hibiscus trionum]|uniref:Glutamine dumper 1 n=1 Tax=Hibiscus trionum TaxID=183268 RepID=A0A9W7IE00_HIBTR|nr:glutamine dumper 1 [Hibiscus trionum]